MLCEGARPPLGIIGVGAFTFTREKLTHWRGEARTLISGLHHSKIKFSVKKPIFSMVRKALANSPRQLGLAEADSPIVTYDR